MGTIYTYYKVKHFSDDTKECYVGSAENIQRRMYEHKHAIGHSKLEEASLLAPLPNETKPRWLASQAAIEFWLLYRSPVDSSKKKMAEKKEIHW